MVVDDSEEIRQTLHEVLTVEGHDVTTAANGREALERMVSSRPDVVLLDLMMPVLDGWGFLEALRAHKESTPVIVVTAFGEATIPAAPMILHKPIAMDELRAALAKVK